MIAPYLCALACVAYACLLAWLLRPRGRLVAMARGGDVFRPTLLLMAFVVVSSLLAVGVCLLAIWASAEGTR